MGLFRNSKESQFRICNPWKPQASMEDKGEERSFIEEKRGWGGAESTGAESFGGNWELKV